MVACSEGSSGTDEPAPGTGGSTSTATGVGGSGTPTGGQSGGLAGSGGLTAAGGKTTSGGASANGGTSSAGGTSAAGGSTIQFDDELTGSPCSGDADCSTIGTIDTYCKLDWAGGYCTAFCDSFGDCPRDGDLCQNSLCVRRCEPGGLCRTGYKCSAFACVPQ
ncbi:MAG: hypothetical protein QM784_37100 [Polyangiaceae bacterium]